MSKVVQTKTTTLQDTGLSPDIARRIYNVLPLSSSTRLLQLEGGTYDNALKASLIVVDIDSTSCPKYECISYTWGTETSPNVINIDGNDVPLRFNLDQGLRRLRLAGKPRLLWVDALCIRQDDRDEKAQQVTMIGKIFQKATRVLAWLGEHHNGSETLFDLSEAAAAQLYNQNRDEFRQKYYTLGKFMDRLYWQRTWVVAEIICARELLVCCGSDAIKWEHLLKYKLTDVTRFDQGWARRLTKLDDARRGHKFAQDPSHLSDVEWEGHREVQGYLYAAENTNCFERRDKIFSLRAILHGTSIHDDIRVDYNASVPELCASVLKAAFVAYEGDQSNVAEFLLLSIQLDKSLQLTLGERLQMVDLLLADQDGLNSPVLYVVNDIFSDGLVEKFFGIEYEPCEVEWSWQEKRDHIFAWRNKARLTGKWPAS